MVGRGVQIFLSFTDEHEMRCKCVEFGENICPWIPKLSKVH